MRPIIVMLLLIMATATAGQELAGRVSDEKKEPLLSAVVQVYKGDKLIGGTVTDFDGDYQIKAMDTGYYDVLIVLNGYDSSLTNRVRIDSGQRTVINVQLQPRSVSFSAMVVRTYKTHVASKPIIQRSEMQTIPTTQITDVVSTTAGVYQQKRMGNEQLYIIDGVQVQGATGIIMGRGVIDQYYEPSAESYKKQPENDFRRVQASPVSTLSVDVDRASYSNVRRYIWSGYNPPADAVRIEEMVNYFNYQYPQPKGNDPIAIQTELTPCPWHEGHKILHVGMQALTVNTDDLPPSNLVFLIDVSGSMESPERLPLLVAGMKLLTAQLRAVDKVSIVTYAGMAGLVLPPTSGNKKAEILAALDRLTAGGSTAGGEGIQLAYKVAADDYVKGGNNRVILATDGDFNVGISNDNELEDLITAKRKTGIFLTCLGFGTGNYKDEKMEMMADKGNGNYDYIDNIKEAEKTLVSEFGGTLFTVAKDVKAQIEFNPAKVAGYRVIGYENRMLNTEDFKDDKKDAGDMGSGHTVTIMYEIIPVGVSSAWLPAGDSLKYQQPAPTAATAGDDLATIKFRYKQPDGDTSKEMIHIVADHTAGAREVTENSRFAEAVAMFGMLLKDSKYAGSSTYKDVIAMARNSSSHDAGGYRSEFVKLVKAARQHERRGREK